MAGESEKKYRILEKIGEGSFGDVYLAAAPEGGAPVALKFLRLDAGSPPEAVTLFKREFELLRELQHPHLANVLDFGYDEARKQYFFSAEYCSGRDFLAACADRPLEFFEDALVQVLTALDHIHSQGVIHSDIKPENILVAEREGRPWCKLLDFGVAGRLRSGSAGVGGSPAYMAPELLGPEPRIDPRSDLYSLGMIVLQRLTGGLPFPAGNAKSAKEWHLRGKIPESAWRSDTPRYLRELAEKLLAKQVGERFSNARVVLNFLNLGTSGRYQNTEAQLHAEIPLEGPLVERREEVLDGLQERIKGFFRAPGGAAVCWLQGEKGIGKSRLLAELRQFLAVQEIASCSLVCDWEVPVWPKLAEFLELPTFSHDKMEKDWLLLRRVDALREAARKRPLCLLIDDFHKMEGDFREAVLKLAAPPVAGEAPAPLFVVATTEEDLAAAVPLRRISAKGVLQYVQRILGGDHRVHKLADLLYRYSCGLPLLMAEGLRYLAPRLYRGENLEEMPADPRLASLYEEKIRGLSESELDLLHTTALFFRPVSDTELQDALGLSPGELGALTKNLIRSQLVVPRVETGADGKVATVYQIGSGALASSLIEGLPAERRRTLHRHIAEGLERAGGAGEEIAYHWSKAGLAERAARSYERAAAALQSQGQISSAARCLAKAVQHSERGSAVWRDGLTELVRLHILTGAYPEAEAALRDLEGYPSWDIDELRGRIAFKRRDFASAQAHYQRALDRVPAEQVYQRTLLENALGNVELQSGRAQEAVQRFRNTLEMERSLSVEEQVKVNNNLGIALALVGDGRAALEFYEERGARLRGHLKPEEEIVLLNGRSYVCLQTGRYEEAISDLKKAMQLAEQSGAMHPLSSIMGNLVTALLKEGRYAESLPLLEKIVAFQERLGNARDLSYNLLRQGSVYLTLGMGEKAKHCFESGKRHSQHSDQSLLLWYLLVEGYWEREHGSLERAGELFRALELEATRGASPEIAAWAVYAQADLAFEQKNLAACRALLDKMQTNSQDKEFLARRHLLEAKVSAWEKGKDAERLFAQVESECLQGHYREILWEVYHDWALSRERLQGHQAALPLYEQGVRVVEAIVGSLPEEYRDRYLNQRLRKKLFEDWKQSRSLPMARMTDRIKGFFRERLQRAPRH